MLCQISVKNYKSIRDEVTFDMQAAAISDQNDKIIQDIDGECFLPVSVIYGPNGGGKSNVLEAVHTLNSKVLRPLCATCEKRDCDYKARKMPVEPFAFSEESRNAPTAFEIFFRTKTAEYRYTLHIWQEQVVYESLDKVKLESGRRSALFVRKGEEIQLKGAFGKFKISEDLSQTLPLLSYLGITYMKNEIVSDVLDWFEHSIDFLNYGNPYQEIKTAIAKSEDIKVLILDMIREMDLDIEDFRFEEKDEHSFEVYTKHIVEGYCAELALSEESSGTKKLFGLLPYIARSLVRGTTLIIGELDAKIHPLLLQHIIEMYTDKSINQHGAQLIFTSHDLSTMNRNNFRRDEIWFVAKGKSQNSKLYSLVEFKEEENISIDKETKYDKQYLEGRYGAIFAENYRLGENQCQKLLGETDRIKPIGRKSGVRNT